MDRRKDYITVKREVYVQRRNWGPDDDYLVIPEFQISEMDFQPGELVRVIVEKIEGVE